MSSRYDPHVEWYEAFRPSLSADEVDLLGRLLGPGRGRCLDIGCGTGVAIPELSRLGWTVVGVDPSEEMLARVRLFGAELHQAPGESLPFADESFDAAVSIWTHTDADDFGALVAEAARVLRRAAPFVYIGAHPCFVGPHSRFFAAEGVPLLHEGYQSVGRYTGGPAFNPDGLRAKVGATHLPLGLFVRAFLDAGLVIRRFEESGDGEYPHALAVGCLRAS
ncbi:MAG TPA: methyltransferase domain-containing protein [Gaiellaceae bacterium]|nr:methyltransferase domain-containing protein [Gaiellaceae bacterium]